MFASQGNDVYSKHSWPLSTSERWHYGRGSWGRWKPPEGLGKKCNIPHSYLFLAPQLLLETTYFMRLILIFDWYMSIYADWSKCSLVATHNFNDFVYPYYEAPMSIFIFSSIPVHAKKYPQKFLSKVWFRSGLSWHVTHG